MSSNSLHAEVKAAVSSVGATWEAGSALITDFLRALHELSFTSRYSQNALLADVQLVLGPTAMKHLAHVLSAQEADLSNPPDIQGCELDRRIALNCKERGFTLDCGRRLIARFLKALDERRLDAHGNIDSAPIMVYWEIGHEAAYHLAGAYAGDARDEVATELFGYLDPSLRRFDKLVELWQMERDLEREARE